MKKITLGCSGLEVPSVAVGCMRINTLKAPLEAAKFVAAAVENGANYFDHADIYANGECEKVFAQAVKDARIARKDILLQSKCGIHRGVGYDFSKKHIIDSVEGILSRLKTDYLDVLLLHRPDTLMEPEEVAEAFDLLYASGKVRNFGVSNQDPYTMQLLQSALSQPLVANQLQLSLTNASLIAHSLNINTEAEGGIGRDNGVLNYCRIHDITIQPWSPFQYGFFSGVFLDNDKFPVLNAKINEIAAVHGVSNTTIVMAWLLRHPAKMQPVTGTMNITRLKDCIAACDITLTRKEWYDLYLAAGHRLP